MLYAYEQNNRVKSGISFTDKNGQRSKSYKTFITDSAIGFVVYSSKEILQVLNRAIKKNLKLKVRRNISIVNGLIERICVRLFRVYGI